MAKKSKDSRRRNRALEERKKKARDGGVSARRGPASALKSAESTRGSGGSTRTRRDSPGARRDLGRMRRAVVAERYKTLNDELTASNEELKSLLDEMDIRNIDLDRANSDLKNLIANTTIPIVMVDRELRIRRMTTAAAATFRVRPSDIGRPLMHIRPDLAVASLDQLIRGVLETLAPVEVDVCDEKDHWYSLRIRPCRASDGKVDGAILVLNDIDTMKKLNQALRASEEFLGDILSTVREPLLVLDDNLKVLYASPSFTKAFAVSPAETMGYPVYRLGNEQWNIPKLRAALERVISEDKSVIDFVVEHDFPSLGPRAMMLNARRIGDAHHKPMLLLAIEDVTERLRSESEMERSNAGLEALVEDRTAALRELSAKLLRAQDAERRRIARELHDDLGQNLVLAKVTLAGIRERAGHRGGEAKIFADMKETLDRCVTATRTMSYLLHPPLLDEAGLASALKVYAQGFAERSGIQVTLAMEDKLPRISENAELALFRIVQESLTNVSRHSESRSVQIRIEQGDAGVNLQVQDQGRGMSAEAVARLNAGGAGGGVGLRSMRERVSELGGSFDIQSSAKGTLIRVAIPLAGSGAGASAASA